MKKVVVAVTLGFFGTLSAAGEMFVRAIISPFAPFGHSF